MYTKNEPKKMLHTFISADVFNISTTFEPAQNANVISETPCVNDKPLFVLKTMNTGSHCTLNSTSHILSKSSMEFICMPSLNNNSPNVLV